MVCMGIETKRDKSIDVMKGMLIILVVYAHTWPWCRNWIYLFHMAVFLMASGYCYKGGINSVKELVNYTFRKIKSLYIPFVMCNGLFYCLSNVFIKIYVYTDNPDFLLSTSSFPVDQSIIKAMGLSELVIKLAKTLAFVGVSQLGTATWFFTILFIVQIVHATFNFLANKANEKQKIILNVVLLIINLLAAQYITMFHITGLFVIVRFPCCYAAYLLGVLVRRIKWKKLYTWWMGLISLVLLIILNFFSSIELSGENIDNIVVFVITSLSGWILMLSLAKMIRTNRILEFIGKHTISIICFHVLAYKLVSSLYIKLYSLPQYMLASFHVIFTANEIWKIFYTAVGVIVPLCVGLLYRKSIACLTSKLKLLKK